MDRGVRLAGDGCVGVEASAGSALGPVPWDGVLGAWRGLGGAGCCDWLRLAGVDCEWLRGYGWLRVARNAARRCCDRRRLGPQSKKIRTRRIRVQRRALFVLLLPRVSAAPIHTSPPPNLKLSLSFSTRGFAHPLRLSRDTITTNTHHESLQLQLQVNSPSLLSHPTHDAMDSEDQLPHQFIHNTLPTEHYDRESL